MKYVVAVSGGVDSVVLLDTLAKITEHQLIVAHFDHGIRADSAADAHFVAGFADQYKLPLETKREELGKDTSENKARTRRYAFLEAVATKHKATIVTAHHLDDIIETIAINLIRGTGWRGLAVLNRSDIERPLLSWSKQEIYDYALRHGLEWVEDETNQSDTYLRNRVRRALTGNLTRAELADLRTTQLKLAADIENETQKCRSNQRYFYTMLDEPTALELLWAELAADNLSLTRPQRRQLWLAIKTALPGTSLQAGNGVTVHFTTREFIVNPSL